MSCLKGGTHMYIKMFHIRAGENQVGDALKKISGWVNAFCDERPGQVVDILVDIVTASTEVRHKDVEGYPVDYKASVTEKRQLDIICTVKYTM